MRRREFVATAGGATAALGAGTRPAAAQEEQPDFGGYISGANGGSYADMRGESAVTVDVGAGGQGLAFAPTGLWIDPGTTVTFEWTGEGGSHNVLPQDVPDESDWAGFEEVVDEEGFTYEHTFEAGGLFTYYCRPHQQLDMLGAIAVGGDVPTVGGGGESGPVDPEEMGVPIQAHFVGIATILAIVVSLVFTFYALKYGESAHSSSPKR